MAEKHVITALVKKRAELAGEIEQLTKQIEATRSGLVHIDGALQVFGYDDPDLIKAKDLARAARLFQRGELTRFILDSLRVAPKGLTQAQICTAIIQQKGWSADDAPLVKADQDPVEQRAQQADGEGAGSARADGWPQSPVPDRDQ